MKVAGEVPLRLGLASMPEGPCGLGPGSSESSEHVLRGPPLGSAGPSGLPCGCSFCFLETSAFYSHRKWEKSGSRQQLGVTACHVLSETSQTQQDICCVVPYVRSWEEWEPPRQRVDGGRGAGGAGGSQCFVGTVSVLHEAGSPGEGGGDAAPSV